MGELLINGKDALSTWGVRMGNGFIDALDSPLSTKEYIENESRMENGKRILAKNVKLASRVVTLPFTIEGSSQLDYQSKKKSFESELYNGYLTVQVPGNSSDIFKLYYKGQSSSYGQNKERTFGKFSAKFEEANPDDRQ